MGEQQRDRSLEAGRYEYAVEVKPLTSYTPAEEYHQDYLGKHPGGYCHIGRELFDEAARAVPDRDA